MIFQPLNLIYSRLSCNQALNKPFDQAARISQLNVSTRRISFLFSCHMYSLFPLSFCPLRPFHTGPYVSPPSLPLALSLAWMPVCHPSESFGRRLFWSWPSVALRAEGELIDGAVSSSSLRFVFFLYCPSLFSLLHFSETFFLFYLVSSQHIYLNLFADF